MRIRRSYVGDLTEKHREYTNWRDMSRSRKKSKLFISDLFEIYFHKNEKFAVFQANEGHGMLSGTNLCQLFCKHTNKHRIQLSFADEQNLFGIVHVHMMSLTFSVYVLDFVCE